MLTIFLYSILLVTCCSRYEARPTANLTRKCNDTKTPIVKTTTIVTTTQIIEQEECIDGVVKTKTKVKSTTKITGPDGITTIEKPTDPRVAALASLTDGEATTTLENEATTAAPSTIKSSPKATAQPTTEITTTTTKATNPITKKTSTTTIEKKVPSRKVRQVTTSSCKTGGKLLEPCVKSCEDACAEKLTCLTNIKPAAHSSGAGDESATDGLCLPEPTTPRLKK